MRQEKVISLAAIAIEPRDPRRVLTLVEPALRLSDFLDELIDSPTLFSRGRRDLLWYRQVAFAQSYIDASR